MKSIKYIVAALAVAALATASYATVTVNWSSGVDTYISGSGGASDYLTGSDELGVFTGTPSVGDFVPLAATVDLGLADGVIGGTGAASATFTAGSNGHLQLGFAAFGSGADAGEEFLGYVSDTNNGSWKLPADTDLTPSTTFDIQTFFAQTGGSATLAPGAVVLLGSVGLDTSVSPAYQLLEAVPEPSSIALVVLGLLGGIGLIRRRR